MSSMNNTITNKGTSVLQQIINLITEYSFLTIIIIFGLMFFFSVVVTMFYRNIPNSRENTGTFDSIYILVFTIIFIAIIFKFMGAETVLYGKKFDLGLGVYLGIIFFIAFVMGG